MKRTVGFGLVLGLVAATSVAAPPKLESRPLTCVPDGGNAMLRVTLPAPVPLESARVYFRAAQEADRGEYYVELRHRGDGEYWGLLPVPQARTEKVEYRFEIVEAGGAVTGTDLLTAPVRHDCVVSLTGEEKRFARDLVIGRTRRNQSTKPPGFRCTGIVGEIDVAGELRPNTDCR